MDVASLLLKVGIKADTDALEKLQSKLESINSKLRILAGAEIIKGLFHLTENFGHSALELENTAAAAGLTTEAMQKLQFAVAQSGGNASELGMTMSHLARMIESAKLGGDEAITTFYKLGISQQAIQSYHNTEDALFGVMDALQKIKDPIKQHALLDQALGQGSRGLGRFALNGAAAARATTQSAKAMGAIIPAGTVRKLADAKAAMDGLHQIMKATAASIGGFFAPSLITLVRGVEGFFAANKELISSKLERWVWNVSVGFGELYAILYILARETLSFAKKHQTLVNLAIDWAPALLAVAIALTNVGSGISTIHTAMKAAAVLWAFFSSTTFLIASMFVLAAAGLASFGLAFEAFWEVLNGKKIEDTPVVKLLKFLANPGKITAIADYFGGTLGKIVHEFDAASAERGSLLQGDPVSRYDAPTGFLGRVPTLVENMNAAKAQMSQPPGYLARPNTSMPTATSFEPSIVSNNTINIPAGVTVKQAQDAVANGVQGFLNRDLQQSMRRLYAPQLY